jgi:hypothetical protein
MNEYQQQIQSYVQLKKDEFSLLNDYNTKVISFGFAAFFALATYLKPFCQSYNCHAFVFSLLFMSMSVAIFVVFELYRSILLNKHARDGALSLDKLPDNNPMLLIDEKHKINWVRFQRYHPYFFYPSLLTGLAALVLLFYCYIKVLIA